MSPLRSPGRAAAVPRIAEVFARLGFDGASLSAIGQATGLGKGSLYNFFPGGKEEMALAVLDEKDAWFDREIFGPLASATPESVDGMFDAVTIHLRSGQRLCLVGAFAISGGCDRFGGRIQAFFRRWTETLALALQSRGFSPRKARARAEEVIAGIQGAIILAQAFDDPGSFDRLIARLRRRARPKKS